MKRYKDIDVVISGSSKAQCVYCGEKLYSSKERTRGLCDDCYDIYYTHERADDRW